MEEKEINPSDDSIDIDDDDILSEADEFDCADGGKLTRRKRLILRSTSVLPALLTIMNAICGFASIHYATKDGFGHAEPNNLFTAAWLIGIAMIFDMLDGRVARMTSRASDFGGQLDSLCDAVGFGVAPAVLMLRTVVTTLREHLAGQPFLPVVERAIWCIAAIYLACTILRLARFNVENDTDESSHMDFRGLPGPGAALMMGSSVLLYVRLLGEPLCNQQYLWWGISVAFPIITLIAGLLMVSRLPYLHMVNQYLSGKRSFTYLVRLVIIVVALVLQFYLVTVIIAIIYLISGPIRSVKNRIWKNA